MAILPLLCVMLLLFSCGKDDPVGPQNPRPVLLNHSPDYAWVGSGALEVAILGEDFIPNSTVLWRDAERATTFVDSTRLTVILPAADLEVSGGGQLNVFNPQPGGGRSGPGLITILAPGDPTLSGIDPVQAVAGRALDLAIFGSGFVRDSVVMVNGVGRETEFINSGYLRTGFTAEEMQAVRVDTLTVLNPEDAGGLSNFELWTVREENRVPVLLSITPDVIAPGGPDRGAVPVVLRGESFVPDSQVFLDYSELPTIYISETEIHWTRIWYDLSMPGTRHVVVHNPEPGGGYSDTLLFTVQNVVPEVTSLSPEGAGVGATSLTLTIEGSGFSRNSVVRWNGHDVTTRFSDTDLLFANLGPEDLEQPGPVEVTVFNPPPAGGISETWSFCLYRDIPLAINDMLYDAGRNRIYASVSAAGARVGNTLAILDPVSGEVLDSVFLGNEPNALAMSDDGRFLYVGQNTTGAVTRLVLDSMSSDLTFTLGMGSRYRYRPEDMVVLPENPAAVVVSRFYSEITPRHAGVAVYDNGIMRPVETPGHTGPNRLEYAGGTGLYCGLRTEFIDGSYYSLQVDDSGVTVLKTNADIGGEYASEIVYANGMVYSGNGKIIEPVTLILYATISARGPVAPVPSLDRIFYIKDHPDNAYDDKTVGIYNMTTQELEASIALGPITGFMKDLLYVGGDRLVFRTTMGRVIIVEHPLVGISD